MFEYAGVRIRPIEEPDLARMVELRANPDVWMHLGNIGMIGLAQQHHWFAHLHNSATARYYILCSADIDFLGIVRTDEIDVINRSMRIGGDILPEYQGKGYGRKMFALLKTYCFDYLNMHRLWLLVLDTNTRAMALYTKSGFVEEGRQREAIYRAGAYADYIMMSMLRSEYLKERKNTP